MLLVNEVLHLQQNRAKAVQENEKHHCRKLAKNNKHLQYKLAFKNITCLINPTTIVAVTILMSSIPTHTTDSS